MVIRLRREVGLAFAWLVFPLVPALLEDAYYQMVTLGDPDPHGWRGLQWGLFLGPLLGYGFLAGATIDIANETFRDRRSWQGLLARGDLWVMVGPWAGAILWTACFFGLAFLDNLIPRNWHLDWHTPQGWGETWVNRGLSWTLNGFVFVSFAYGWILLAWLILCRAGRVGLWARTLYRGLITTILFVGSLFGTFWTITSVYRSYFFDTRVMPVVALLLGLISMSGCGAPVTYGDVRRRELFHAMLTAWVVGLALMWRWWSRGHSILRGVDRGESEPSDSSGGSASADEG